MYRIVPGIGSGVYVGINIVFAVIAAWLKASQRSPVVVRMSMFSVKGFVPLHFLSSVKHPLNNAIHFEVAKLI